MSGLKTFIAGLILAGSAPGALTAAGDIHWTFATCPGRLYALMEHQWLINDPDADRTEAQRAAMISLLEATMPPDRGRDVLARRIEAKQAQAVLLTRATFNDDPDDARWALGRAEAEIAHCVGMLLG